MTEQRQLIMARTTTSTSYIPCFDVPWAVKRDRDRDRDRDREP
jgi:hypothetical protein